MRLLIFALIVLGGAAGGVAFGADAETAAILGSLGCAMAWAGAWLLFAHVERRRM